MTDQIRARGKRKQNQTKVGAIPLALVAVGTVAIILLIITDPGSWLKTFVREHYIDTVTVLPCMVLLAMLGLIVGIDPYIRGDLRRTMLQIIVVAILLVAQNYLESRLARGEPRWLFRTLVAVFGYAMRPVILGLFLHIVAPEHNYTWVWILVGINAVINATALFTDICFTIMPSNGYRGGPLSNSCLYVSALLMASLLYVTLRLFHSQRLRESWVPVLVLMIITFATLLDYNVGKIDQPVSYLTGAMVIGCVVYYTWLHLQFVREHEQDLKAGQRMQLMMSQIRPHFLYNSLGTIEELCDSDPKTAKRATVQFAQYLRGNMDSIGQEGEIPFEKELEHTRLYLALEKLRFEDALTVEYEIECADFTIPPLTLEPLAENAVRHGVRGNPDGRGSVLISTRETETAYEISVRDDGPGFDPEAAEKKEGSHVGIRNVRERVGRARGGEVRFEPAPGGGTIATIVLPKE